MMRIIQFTTDNREQFREHDTPEPHFGAAPEALLQGLCSLPGIEVHVVSCVRRPVSVPERIFGNIRYHAVEVPKSGWMSTFYQGCIRATRRLVADLEPDIVHGQGTERDCAMNATHSGRPNVLTIHGNMSELNRLGINFQNQRLYGFLASRLETHALRRTAGVFCNSAYTESLVAQRARRTWRVPNAIRQPFFRPPRESPSTGGLPLLLNIGHLGPRKRQLEILRMAGEIHREGHCFKLIFLGALSEGTPYGDAFVEELKRAETEGYARHAGFLNAEALIDLMDRSHGFVHFPLEESFGLVVAEAMARGLKLFGANLGGIKEIAGGIPGTELCDSFEDLKQRMIDWLGQSVPRAPESAAVVRERYAPEVVARCHLEIYREVLGG
jgi:glycosyltransferase involved in cell wall biosynthesis